MRFFYTRILNSRAYRKNTPAGRRMIDVAVRALLALDCTDDEIATAFNPGLDPGIQRLRERAARRFYPRPL